MSQLIFCLVSSASMFQGVRKSLILVIGMGTLKAEKKSIFPHSNIKSSPECASWAAWQYAPPLLLCPVRSGPGSTHREWEVCWGGVSKGSSRSPYFQSFPHSLLKHDHRLQLCPLMFSSSTLTPLLSLLFPLVYFHHSYRNNTVLSE